MPNHFEGNLAKKAENDASPYAEQFDDFEEVHSESGIVTKKDRSSANDYPELEEDALEPIELKPMDVSDDSSRAEEAMEGLEDLAASDRRKSTHNYARFKKVDSEKVAVLESVKPPMSPSQRAVAEKRELLNRELDALSEGDVVRDEVARKLKSGEIPKPISTRIRETKDRIAERETNIERLKQSTEDFIGEKAAIEAQSEKRLKAMKIANRANAAAEAMAFEERAKPMREVARQFGREDGLAERMRQEGEIESELEIGPDGKIAGLKNLPLVDWNVFRRGMAARMETIKNQIVLLLEQPSSSKRNRALKALELESAEWMKMYQDGKIMEESGANPKDIHLHNRMYRQIETVTPKELDKTDTETLAITPEERLQKGLEILEKQDKIVDELLKKASDVMWSIDETPLGKESAQRKALSELLKGAESYRNMRKASIAEEIQYLRTLEQPDALDLRTRRLSMLAQQSETGIAHLKESLARIKPESVADAKEAIDTLEERVSEYRGDIQSWHEKPIRKEAMEARRLDLEEKIREKEMEMDRQDWIEFNPTLEAPESIHQSATELTERHRTEVRAALQRIYGLVNEKAQIATERAAIIEERIDRELEALHVEIDPVAFDVDLTELNDAAEGTVDVDLTDLNERVEGYKDIEVDTSDFGKKKRSKKKAA